MPTVLYGGERELNLFTAGEPHPAMLQYAREQAQFIGNYIQQTGSTFAQGVVQSYENFYSDDALRHARSALSKVGSYFQADKIVELTSIYDIQQAQPLMQRYIMAEPTLAEMYHQGRCAGYGYTDPFPGQFGEANYNYRRVMNGIMVETPATEDEPDGNTEFHIFIEELVENDRELALHEQSAIMETWERVRFSLAHSLIDPTSQSGDML
jgi:hypothetical protein